MIPMVHFLQKWEKEIELQSQPENRGRYLPAWVLSLLKLREPVRADRDSQAIRESAMPKDAHLLFPDMRLEANEALWCVED